MRKKFLVWAVLAAILLGAMPLFTAAESVEENLALGLSYTVTTGEPVAYSHANFSENGVDFDVNNGQLTDGVTASTEENDIAWYRAFRGRSRIITFDLGTECAINHINAGFLHKKASGIYAPRYIRLSLSANGSDYQLIEDFANDFPIHSDDIRRCEIALKPKRVYAARYVKIEFTSDIFAFCDEISVYGSKTLSGKEKNIKPDEAIEAPGYFQALGGITDIVKMYNGYYPDSDIGYLTEDELLPYVAYVDTSGNIAGTMFDGMAFLPCHTDYPSGGRLVKTNGKKGAVMSDWELYFENTFADDYNLSALDKTVGKVYTALAKEEKYKVFLTIPYPTILEDAFGDIDGDGIFEMCQTLEERLDIIKWYSDKCISKFEEKQFANLELAGFYWYREEINYSDSDHEDDLVKRMNAYVQEKDMLTLFDAFYLSTGFDHWKELGFSGSVMQPNVAFDTYGYFKIPMLSEFAVSAYNNNLGTEIETAEPYKFSGDEYLSAGKNYESYLYYGAKQGYMYSLKTYYQGAGPGTYYDFCYADTQTPKGRYLRRLYDLTHAFITKTYKNNAPVLSVEDINLIAGDKSALSAMQITDADSYWEDIVIEFTAKPAHGKAAVGTGKQSIFYTPDENFVGEDTFTVRAYDGFNYSAEVTVKVTVSESDQSFAYSFVDNTSDSDAASSSEKQEDVPIWLIPLLGILGFAMVAVAVGTVIKKRK